MPSLLEGVLVGALVIMLVGPVFIALIQTSLSQGFLPAIAFASGVWLSDSIILMFSWYGISEVVKGQDYLAWLGIPGGLILVGFGLSSVFRPVSTGSVPNLSNAGHAGRIVLKGFGINCINPMTILFWSGLVSYEIISFNHSPGQRLAFFTGVLLAMMSGDLAKAYFASRLRGIMTPRVMLRVNRLVGILLIGFGGRLLYLALNGSLV